MDNSSYKKVQQAQQAQQVSPHLKCVSTHVYSIKDTKYPVAGVAGVALGGVFIND